MSDKLENGSWAEWRRLVLSELKRLNEDVDVIKDKQQQIEIRTATNQAKLVMFGSIATIIIGIAASVLTHFLTK